MRAVLTKSLTIRGFINTEFVAEHYAEFLRIVSAGLADGRIRYREDVTEGFENAPAAFMGLFKGELRQGAGRCADAPRAEDEASARHQGL